MRYLVIGLYVLSAIFFSVPSAHAASCNVRGDGSGDTCPTGQECKNTAACVRDPNASGSGPQTVICGGGTCQPKTNSTPQTPVQQGQTPNANTGSCMIKTDGFDSCPSGMQCIETKACTIDPNGGVGTDGTARKICGSGHCVAKTQISTIPPKQGDTCTHAITDPVGTCGQGNNLVCESTGNCTGTGLAQTCSGICKSAGGSGQDCTVSPGLNGNQGTQGSCQAGFVCKGGSNCAASFCKGTCELAPTDRPKLPPVPPPPCAPGQLVDGVCKSFLTAFGTINTDASSFLLKIFAMALAIAGGLAILLIIRAGYIILTSAGNGERVKKGREQLVAAIVGLFFIIFSFVILQVIGVDILKLPDFIGAGQIAPGGTCDPNNNTCSNGYVCNYNGSTGQCVKDTTTSDNVTRTGARGDLCGAAGQPKCGNGLICNPSSAICEPDPAKCGCQTAQMCRNATQGLSMGKGTCATGEILCCTP